MKKALIVGGIVLGVLVLGLFALPFVVDVDHFRPEIETKLQSSLGRNVQLGKVSLSIWHGGVAVDDVSIADDPAFGSAPFLKAKSIGVGVDFLPLIFSKALNVNSINIDEPEIRLVQAANGKWNYSTLGTSAAPAAKHHSRSESRGPQKASSTATLSIARLKVGDGRIVIQHLGAKAQPSTYQDVNLTASNIGYTSPIPFSLNAEPPGGGKLSVEGTAGPILQANPEQSPLEATVKLNDMDLAHSGLLDPSSGMAGTAKFDGTLKSDGKVARSEGTATVQKLRLVKGGAPAKEPVSLDYAAQYNPQTEQGSVERGDIHFGKSTAHLTGNFDTRGQSAAVHMKLNGKSLPVSDVEGLLPALGVVLPAGASLQGGTADANLSLDGPVDRLVTAGTVNLQNAKLAGFDLARKMSALSALAGLKGGQDTMIQLLSSNLRIAPEGIRTDNLDLVVPNVGEITGNGTIASNNALDFRMLAKLNAANSLLGGVGKLASFGQSNGQVPFLISGTTQNPVFLPDVGRAVVGTAASPAKGVGSILGGFFGRKK